MIKPVYELSFTELCKAIARAWEEENSHDLWRLCEHYYERFRRYPIVDDIERFKKI